MLEPCEAPRDLLGKRGDETVIAIGVERLFPGEVWPCAAMMSRNHMKNNFLHVGCQLPKLGCALNVQERAELVAVVGADVALLPLRSRYQVLAGLGVPVGGIWIANTPLPNLAFLAKIVDPCGKRHGVLELARQVHCLDHPVDVL